MVDNASLFDRWLLKLVPLQLREQLVAGSEDFIRVRALSTMLVVCTAVSLITLLFLLVITLFSDKEVFRLLYITIALSAFLGAETLFFYKFCNFRVSATFLSMSYFIFVILLVIGSGGYQSPMMSLLITSPMIAFLMGGRQEGFHNAIFVALMVFGLIFVDYQTIEMINFLGEQSEYLVSSVCWIITLTVILSCLLVYDTALEKRG